jgi:hypothetical protein
MERTRGEKRTSKRKEQTVHCPNTGPHFTLYTVYSTDALLNRE